MDLFTRIARDNHRARGFTYTEADMTDDYNSPPGQKVSDARPDSHRAPPDTRSWFDKLIARIDPWFSRLFQGRRP